MVTLAFITSTNDLTTPRMAKISMRDHQNNKCESSTLAFLPKLVLLIGNFARASIIKLGHHVTRLRRAADALRVIATRQYLNSSANAEVRVRISIVWNWNRRGGLGANFKKRIGG